LEAYFPPSKPVTLLLDPNLNLNQNLDGRRYKRDHSISNHTYRSNNPPTNTNMKTMQSIVASVSSGGEPFHKPPMASREGCTVAGARAALDAAGFFFSANVNIFSLDDEELKQVFGRTLNTKIRE